MGVEAKPLPSSDHRHTHIDTSSPPSLLHMKGAVSLTLSLCKWKFILPCAQPGPSSHCSLHPEGAHLFPLCPCTLSLLLCVSKICLSYVPAKEQSLFHATFLYKISILYKSVSIIIPCSHQNLQSYGTMMRNLSYAGKTTKATFFLLLTPSCLPKHN